MNNRCIMPEMPYCPCCRYGLVDCHIDDPAFSEWICLLESMEALQPAMINDENGGVHA